MIVLLLFIAQVEITAELKAEYRGKELMIGDPFEITLTAAYPKGTELSEPFVDSLEPFIIVDQKNEIVEHEGTVRNTYEMKLVPFGTGSLRVPEFRFLRRKGDTVDTLSSAAISLSVASVLPEDMQDINDIKKAVEFPNFLPLIIAAAMIAAAVIGYAAYRYLRRLTKVRAGEKPLPPPWIEAIIALENIPAGDWLARGLFKKYYYSMSEILKRYLERRYGFNAAEETTSEIVASLKVHKIPQREEFSRFFTRADMVKYAKYVPPLDEMSGALLAAKELVNMTRPEPATRGDQ
ncbi:hypothetical protein IBX73_01290 [candidate division WOR-3 bacterium]|nr:hypothetical protein [candidate division WOR-3 bacterium]